MGAQNIVLGEGVFSVGGTDIAITRGGGQFVVEREYRTIEADGDLGPVKDRIRKISSIAKLIINALELIPANLNKFYPATEIDTTTTPGHSILKGKADIETTDYNDVTFTGNTKGGKAVIITLKNAINLENLDWSLVDKDEVVAGLTYTATYVEGDNAEPWSIDFED